MASDDQENVTERLYADGVAMVQLLGPQDRLLRMLEREHRDVQVRHLHTAFDVQTQHLVEWHVSAKRRVRGVPTVNQDNAVARLTRQYVAGDPGAAFGQSLADLPLNRWRRLPGQLIDQRHGLRALWIIVALAQPDHFVASGP